MRTEHVCKIKALQDIHEIYIEKNNNIKTKLSKITFPFACQAVKLI